jgi:hypothetical protein
VRLGLGLKKCSREFTSSAPDLDASHLQDVLELRGVLHLEQISVDQHGASVLDQPKNGWNM